MGRFETMPVIALVDVVHDGTPYQAGAVFTVPARVAVRLLMTRQVKAAPKGSAPTPVAAPVPPTPARPPADRPAKDRPRSSGERSTRSKLGPGVPSESPTTAAPDAAAAEDRTYQRRDLVPEE